MEEREMKKNILLVTVLSLLIFSSCGTKPPPPVSYAEHFLFVGRDNQGFVSFAIENKRVKNGERYFIDSFTVLHDEKEGWVELEGNGRSENENKALKSMADSPYFRFGGSREDGFNIESAENDLTLRTEGIVIRISRSDDDGMYQKGSTEATLQWKDRHLKGRILYGYIYNPGFKRFSRGAFSLYDDFYGLYLIVDSVGEVYFHHRDGRPSSIAKKRDGFLFLNGETTVHTFRKVEAKNSKQGLGFYRWPLGWEGPVSLDGNAVSIKIHTKDFKKIKGWIFGGFALSIVQGRISLGGEEKALYGFAELII